MNLVRGRILSQSAGGLNHSAFIHLVFSMVYNLSTLQGEELITMQLLIADKQHLFKEKLTVALSDAQSDYQITQTDSWSGVHRT
ncbi:MAG: hypothetical protein R3E95_04300 [Thiolinea sp.]